eukprot:Phypoly_transcript_07786.p1 GENE.Phypoly_transcript_07786~~Phypoly_transcript_07786.p1  ORF type:complete len:418 (+),score=36.13 Phypoly_transcript_07786:274-1527(+)
MKDSLEMGIVCGSLLGGVAMLTLLLTLFAPCVAQRSKIISLVVFVMLGLVSVSSALNFYRLLPLPLFIYLNFTMFVYWGSFIAPATRHIIFRLLFSWPTAIYQASCMLMLPLTWVTWVFTKWFVLGIVGLCVIGFLQSSLLWKEYVYFSLHENEDTDSLRGTSKPTRARATRSRKPIFNFEEGKRTLKIAQITDPHLGTFMSKERLNDISRTIVNWNPDLVFLTGDFTTIESYFETDKLAYGFAPLKELNGKVFACLGNHDYESLDTVEDALKATGVRLLKDEHALVETPAGTIEIIGTEFTFSRKTGVHQHITQVCQQFPKLEHPRICLVHNPEEFTHFPDGTADLVFSGHTHGGQLGLVSLGLNVTMYGIFKRSPDHGLWRQGNNTLYVHRGTGFYGFPLRLGVSGELSLLHVTI